MSKYPNIYIVGETYTGKSEVVSALVANHNYQSIYTGGFLLQALQKKTGRHGPFKSSEIHAVRDQLISSDGPLYFLKDAVPDKPIVVDGVRSPAVAQALNRNNFLLAVVGSSFKQRNIRAANGRSEHTAKDRLVLPEDLRAVDVLEQTDLDTMTKSADFCFVNEGDHTPSALAAYMLEVLTGQSTKQLTAY